MPTVFLSYSHESKEHSANVLSIANRLVREGIDCVLDQYVESPNEGWLAWMTNNIENSDFVLCICTSQYKEKSGKGVTFEKLIGFQEIYDNRSINQKFIPVILNRNDEESIPSLLKPFQLYDLSRDDGYHKLYRRLTNQPLIVKPKIGSKIPLMVGINDKQKSFQVEKKTIEIKINQSFADFDGNAQEHFINGLTELLKIGSDSIEIKQIREGSVVLTIEMDSSSFKKLADIIYGDFEIGLERKELLKNLKIISVKDASISEDLHKIESEASAIASIDSTRKYQVKLPEFIQWNNSKSAEMLNHVENSSASIEHLDNLAEKNILFGKDFQKLVAETMKLGYDGVLYSFFPRPMYLNAKIQPVLQYSDSYSSFVAHYLDSNYGNRDFILRLALEGRSKPIDWWEEIDSGNISKEEADVIDDARLNFNIQQGLSIPVLSGSFAIAGISVISISKSREHFQTIKSQSLEQLIQVASAYHTKIITSREDTLFFVEPLLASLNDAKKKVLRHLISNQKVQTFPETTGFSQKYAEKMILEIRKDFGDISTNELLYILGMINVHEYL